MVHKRFHPFLEKPRHVASLLYFRQHRGKMVRTHSRQQAGVPCDALQPLGHLPQQRVATRLPEAVVDVLEALQIDQGHGKLVPAAGGAAPEAAEEKSAYNLVITSAGGNKISVIKAVREILPELGLKEAKDLVDAAPATVKENMKKEDAESAKTKLTEAGATVELQ